MGAKRIAVYSPGFPRYLTSRTRPRPARSALAGRALKGRVRADQPARICGALKEAPSGLVRTRGYREASTETEGPCGFRGSRTCSDHFRAPRAQPPSAASDSAEYRAPTRCPRPSCVRDHPVVRRRRHHQRRTRHRDELRAPDGADHRPRIEGHRPGGPADRQRTGVPGFGQTSSSIAEIDRGLWEARRGRAASTSCRR